MLPESAGKDLIGIARETVTAALEGREPRISAHFIQKYSDKQGAYVALYKNGELRGNIGYPDPIYPLWQAVVRGAFGAAFRDPRFLPVDKKDFNELIFEVSVLSPPEPLVAENRKDIPKMISLKSDGLMVRFGPYTGLLLPQSALTNKWNVTEFLEKACQKGGLPPDCWQDRHTKIYRFQTQVFSEAKVTKLAEERLSYSKFPL